jgi:hypothetical protein
MSTEECSLQEDSSVVFPVLISSSHHKIGLVTYSSDLISVQ